MQNPDDYIAPFGDPTDAKDKMTRENEDSFRAGSRTVLLKKGLVLHRFTSGRNAWAFSDCWIDEPTFTTMIREMQNATNASSISLSDKQKRESIHHQLGILGSWNKLARRVKITLKEEVVAHVGEIGPQYVNIELEEHASPVSFERVPGQANGKRRPIQKRIEVRKGGHIQYVIPRFKDRTLDQEENKHAVVNVNAGLFRKGH